MTSALFAALSGLKANESWINVIGNNLANSSTPGFKSSRAVFSDQFSQTLRFASLPSGTLGGRNPMQIGLGTQLADIGRNMGQGALTNTGRTFDLAINGFGHFMLSDGIGTYYTRVGTFGLDATSTLVDQRTGLRVLGLDNGPIVLDTTSFFPPAPTSETTFAGNLPAEITGPLAQTMSSSTAFKSGTKASLTGSTAGPFAIPIGQTWTMDLVVDGGSPQTVAVTSATGTVTAQDIVDAINALPSSGVTASVAPGNFVQITTDRTGSASTLKVLPGQAGFDLVTLTGLSTALVAGTESQATIATPLNDMPSNLVDYQSGDLIDITGLDYDASPISASFIFGTGPGQDGDTIGDLVSFIDNLYPNATASFDSATGQIQLTADETGATDMSITLTDNSGSVGSTNWAQHAFLATVIGTGPDTATTSIEVYDQAGTSHTVTFTFERQDDQSWSVIPSIPATEGTVSGSITGLRFAQNGTISTLPSSTNFTVTFTNQAPQTIHLDFGTPSLFDGVTQFGQEATVFADFQDGYGVGELSNISVNGDGDVQGFYTNGQIRSLGEIGIATFVNDNGLTEIGDNLWTETPNSGIRTVGKGLQAKAGQVVGGALEGSNVEIAEEFVRLIEAQRGFQANARVITTTDEVLAELVNLL
jgi:flagellar hook protein FlgE